MKFIDMGIVVIPEIDFETFINGANAKPSTEQPSPSIASGSEDPGDPGKDQTAVPGECTQQSC